ncbi:ATP-binding protein [Leeia sp.]|uniref:ATP-binding protein n=1 Tax=Leeia sp. TaxID=2884678 RepID=UPI0035B4962B
MKLLSLLSIHSNRPNEANLARLVWLRWLNLGLLLLVSSLASWQWRLQLPDAPLLVIGILLTLFNILTWLRLQGARKGWAVRESELLLQLVIDETALGMVLFFADGASNPLASLLLLPVTLGATLLSAWRASLLLLLAVISYGLLVFYHVPLIQAQAEPLQAWLLHRLGMGLTFLFSAVLLVWFVSRMARSLRQRDAQLAAAREKTLRDEQLIALGTLAAGAAHELGTPLNTLQLLADELADSVPAALQADVQLMQQQLAQCRQSLSTLSRRASHPREAAQDASVTQAILQLAERWALLRPTVALTLHWPEPRPDRQVHWPETLNQALLNLLNNAADAQHGLSNNPIELRLDVNAEALLLHIRDHGPGLDDEARERAGQGIYSSKGGMGVGLLLSNASIEQLGGEVRLTSPPKGGVCCDIHLPWSRLALMGEST